MYRHTNKNTGIFSIKQSAKQGIYPLALSKLSDSSVRKSNLTQDTFISSRLVRESAKGFTLIELLVVIAIIGMLSSVVLASLNSAREKAANTRRVADMRSIQTALELYASANNGAYPNLGWTYNCSGGNWSGLQTALAPYITKLPIDPAGDCAISRVYYVVTNSVNYKVIIHGPPNATTIASSLWDPRRDGGAGCNAGTEASCSILDGATPWAFAVYSSGGSHPAGSAWW